MTRRLIPAALALALSALPAAAKTFVFCSEGSPEALNPQLTTTTIGMDASRPIYNTLVEFVPGTTTIRPALAESWSIGDDGREYVFKLRPGVRFHASETFRPGRAMNADDVIFSFMRQWKPDHPFHRVSGGTYDYFKDLGMPEILESIDKLDDLTVRVRLKRPDAVFLSNIAMPFNIVLSSEYANAMLRAGTPERLDLEPIGTGPFTFVSFQKDVALRYRVFPDFWGERPKIDALVYSITPNPAVRLTKLKSGECHAMAFPNPGDHAKIAKDPALKLHRQEGLNVGCGAPSTWRSTRPRSSTPSTRARAWWRRTRSRRRSGPTTRTWSTTPSTARRRSASSRRRAIRRASRRSSGTCRSAGPTTRTASASPR